MSTSAAPSAILAFFLSLAPAPARAAPEIDPDLCTAELPGYNAFIRLGADGRLLLEGSKLYEKKDTPDPLVTERYFLSKNRTWGKDEGDGGPQTKFLRTRLLGETESRDFLTIRRDSEGRVVAVAADSKNPEVKAEALRLTEEGWTPAPRSHTVEYRYQGKTCLKTLQFEQSSRGRMHILYSEPHCEQLFPIIERIETEEKTDVTRLASAYAEMSRLSAERARRQAAPPPVIGDADTRLSKLSSVDRAVRFANRCVQERGGLASWKKIRAKDAASRAAATANGGAKRKAD